ncbi:MAG: macro domain-containing protein [Myxococcota bacterium]
MSVGIFVGSLVAPELGADAIVNASNPHVALGSGVSGAIAEACGAGFQREVRSAWEEEFDEPLTPDDCLVTGAGRATAFRWVLHVPSVDYTRRDPETGGPSGPDRVRRCVRAALDEARRIEGLRSLAFPLLGAGHGGLGEVAAARVMMETLAEAVRSGAPRPELVVAVLDERTARLVANARAAAGLTDG